MRTELGLGAMAWIAALSVTSCVQQGGGSATGGGPSSVPNCDEGEALSTDGYGALVCVPVAQGGGPLTTECLQDNEPCSEDADCCSSVCSTVDLFCGEPNEGCFLDGDACGFDSDCCSSLCNSADGICGCSPEGGVCGLSTDCCGGECSSDGHCVSVVGLGGGGGRAAPQGGGGASVGGGPSTSGGGGADSMSGGGGAGGSAEPTCFDAVKNGSETDMDCGGSCSPCVHGKQCLVNEDCYGNLCAGHYCSAGLVVSLSFDENNGTLAMDDSGYLNHGTLNEAAIWSAGKLNSGVTLGTGGTVTIANSDTLYAKGGFSISVWIAPSGQAPGGYFNIVGKTLDNTALTEGWGLFSLGLDQICGFAHTFVSRSCTAVANGPTFRHVAFVYDLIVGKIYVDGQLKHTTGMGGAMSETTTDLTLGGTTFGWTGDMDELKIYDVALDDSEVLDLYNNP